VGGTQGQREQFVPQTGYSGGAAKRNNHDAGISNDPEIL
jgi:hypothetical protein